jgi:tRNA wybutosine-synthesizing protein 3
MNVNGGRGRGFRRRTKKLRKIEMEFEARKLAALRALSSPLPDKSRKGDVDAPIAGLIHRINLHPCFFTTSSCSGRISISTSSPPPAIPSGIAQVADVGVAVLGSDPPKLGEDAQEQRMKDKPKKKKKKKGGDWSFVSHYQADPEEVLGALMRTCLKIKEDMYARDNGCEIEQEKDEQHKCGQLGEERYDEQQLNQEENCGKAGEGKDISWKSAAIKEDMYVGQQNCGSLMIFRFEPFILAAECRDLASAQALVSCAISSGFRESGSSLSHNHNLKFKRNWASSYYLRFEL